jgi:hypothetical protein
MKKNGMFQGLIIVESLKDTSVLDSLKITKTETWNVGSRAAGFQPKIWTAKTIEGHCDQLTATAQQISKVLLQRWYANLSDDDTEYVVFYKKIFTHKKGDKKGAQKAINYGKSIGVPEHQLDWV